MVRSTRFGRAVPVPARCDRGDRVYRTYFVNGRGIEAFTPTWTILDRTPFGRQESWEDPAGGRPQGPAYGWWGRPDEYS
ncbi:DUF899 family protein [Pseudonocardia nematodicida]|uniref:DUF899 family protein n=1 Tax=Pseudonocardia nematodicida TaxID=1206997 RepID=A0ABV1KG14_9PSEU